MKALICEMCNSNRLVFQEGLFVCQNCGTKYYFESKESEVEKVLSANYKAQKKQRDSTKASSIDVEISELNKQLSVKRKQLIELKRDDGIKKYELHKQEADLVSKISDIDSKICQMGLFKAKEKKLLMEEKQRLISLLPKQSDLMKEVFEYNKQKKDNEITLNKEISTLMTKIKLLNEERQTIK